MQAARCGYRFASWLIALPGAVGLGAGLLQQAGAAPASTPQLARGEHVARIVCSACHVVARDQEYPPLLAKPAPSFFDIASRPGVSSQRLQHFITNTHWDVDKLPMTMPNPMLSPSDVQAVSSYILSLRQR